MNRRSAMTNKVRFMVQLALLLAVLIIMAVTPLGYLNVGAVSITFLPVPVAIGAMMLGPKGGLLMGLAFGITSLMRCPTNYLGSIFLSASPFYTAVLCLVPRILMGWLTGLFFKALYKTDKTRLLSFLGAGIAAPALNTVLYVSAMMLFFGNTEVMMGYRGDLPVMAFLAGFVGLNGIIELVVCAIVSTAVGKALERFIRGSRHSKTVWNEGE